MASDLRTTRLYKGTDELQKAPRGLGEQRLCATPSRPTDLLTASQVTSPHAPHLRADWRVDSTSLSVRPDDRRWLYGIRRAVLNQAEQTQTIDQPGEIRDLIAPPGHQSASFANTVLELNTSLSVEMNATQLENEQQIPRSF